MMPRFKCSVREQDVTINRAARYARAVSPEFGGLSYLEMMRGVDLYFCTDISREYDPIFKGHAGKLYVVSKRP